jgi:hypothetical protein
VRKLKKPIKKPTPAQLRDCRLETILRNIEARSQSADRMLVKILDQMAHAANAKGINHDG